MEPKHFQLLQKVIYIFTHESTSQQTHSFKVKLRLLCLHIHTEICCAARDCPLQSAELIRTWGKSKLNLCGEWD